MFDPKLASSALGVLARNSLVRHYLLWDWPTLQSRRVLLSFLVFSPFLTTTRHFLPPKRAISPRPTCPCFFRLLMHPFFPSEVVTTSTVLRQLRLTLDVKRAFVVDAPWVHVFEVVTTSTVLRQLRLTLDVKRAFVVDAPWVHVFVQSSLPAYVPPPSAPDLFGLAPIRAPSPALAFIIDFS
ncbi:hypothetical protein DL93DRAFT_2234407 [Clavulina sp. PMI_390]|nr:hypothetical protein DL93DRAFT_2234407 [Clavulina sp. PMI_390]